MKKYAASVRHVMRDRSVATALVALVVSFLLYLLGLKFFLPVVAVLSLACTLPFPSIFRSLLSRLVVSGLFVFSLLQLAAIVQFIVFPASQFVVLAVLLVLLCALAAIALSSLRDKSERVVYADKKDAAALVTALFFLVPLLILVIGIKGSPDIILGTAQMGSIQGIDGANHMAITAEVADAQHLTYEVRSYYPKGFHIATAFTQDAFGISQSKGSWSDNVLLFLAQYVVVGVLMAYAVYYLGRLLSAGIAKARVKRPNNFLVAFCIGPALSLVYMLPFANNGFLNYYYICAVIAVSLVYVYEFYASRKARGTIELNGLSRYYLMGFLALMLGVSMSWPLLIPPLLMVFLLYVLPNKPGHLKSWRPLLVRQNIIVLLGVLVQLVPIYFQLKFSGTDSSQGINLQGGIHVFHYGVLIAGLVLVVYLSLNKTLNEAFREFINNVFQPFYLFLLALATLQYFMVGELRYYAIKSGYLIEILLLLVAAALLIYGYSAAHNRLKVVLMMPVVVLGATLLLIGITGNPLKDTRDLLRTYSKEEKPKFFDEDTKKMTSLGERGDIKNFNITLLHYDTEKKKLYAHMQIPYWASVMRYGGTYNEARAQRCQEGIYTNLLFGTFTDAEQAALVAKIRECADLATHRGERYFVVTDEASKPFIIQTFGNAVEVR